MPTFPTKFSKISLGQAENLLSECLGAEMPLIREYLHTHNEVSWEWDESKHESYLYTD